MRHWKLFTALMLPALGGLAAATYFLGYFDPSLDPGFQEKLASARIGEVQPLIAGEAEILGVTALGVSVREGDVPVVTLHFGRSGDDGLMQAASLSKAVSAAVILILADREGVGLDDDIRHQVTSIDIASLEGGDRPVTLRQLLAHTTGASQSGYPGYPRGTPLPSTAQVVASPPRFFESPLAFDGADGEFRYSGGGYTIAQLWAEDVSTKDFAELADDLLLSPLGMRDATFANPIDGSKGPPRKIIGADAGFTPTQALFTPLADSWHDYPEKAAAGLWTTPSAYAQFVASLLDAAAGEPNAIPQNVAAAMLTPQANTGWKTEAGQLFYGLGVMLELDDDSRVLRVSHTGANAGYRAHFLAKPAASQAPSKVIVAMGNTASAAPLNQAIVNALIER